MEEKGAVSPMAAPCGRTDVLEVENLQVVYGNSIEALRNASFRVEKGSITALLGSNGAGKSTVLKSISGLLKPERGAVTRGEISFGGRSILSVDPPDRVRLGIVHVLEGRRVFGHLTPKENLIAAATMHRERGHVTALIDRMFETFPRLAQRAKAEAGYLSGGEQQMLAIARALLQRPKVLLIDELSMGLAPVIVESILPVLRTVAEQDGTAVILVEQHVRLALAVADQAVVLAHGEVALTEAAGVLAADLPRLESAYLGS